MENVETMKNFKIVLILIMHIVFLMGYAFIAEDFPLSQNEIILSITFVAILVFVSMERWLSHADKD